MYLYFAPSTIPPHTSCTTYIVYMYLVSSTELRKYELSCPPHLYYQLNRRLHLRSSTSSTAEPPSLTLTGVNFLFLVVVVFVVVVCCSALTPTSYSDSLYSTLIPQTSHILPRPSYQKFILRDLSDDIGLFSLRPPSCPLLPLLLFLSLSSRPHKPIHNLPRAVDLLLNWQTHSPIHNLFFLTGQTSLTTELASLRPLTVPHYSAAVRLPHIL